MKPPGWANKLLRWYCSPQLLEELEGDLQEEFDHQQKVNGTARARLDYIRSVIGFMRPYIIKRKSDTSKTMFNMFSHYVTVAFRQLLRHKAFSTINVIGLTLGITCCMMIYLWVQDERSMDNFHANGDRLYNVYTTIHAQSGVQGLYNTPRYFKDNQTFNSIGDAKDVIPEVEGLAMYATGYDMPWGKVETFQVGEKVEKFEGSRANADFFTMFTFPLIVGDARTALKDFSSIAISKKMAKVFFGSPEAAFGKTILYEDSIDFQITAVFDDLPRNTSLKFEFLLNWDRHMSGDVAWSSNYMYSTLLLSPGANVKEVERSLNKLVKPRLDQPDGTTLTLGLQPYRDQYLMAKFIDGKPAAGRITYINIFSGVAIFILVIACINFMNLATARSLKRAKEVGVRKVIGSSRRALIGQFFGESIMLSFVALITSVLLVQLLLPIFNQISGKHIESPWRDLTTWTVLLAVSLITGILAGSYPALFLSSLKPVKVLKGVISYTQSAIMIRRSLAVFQFGLSILLLIATIVMSRQTNFMQSVDIGYQKENLLYFTLEGSMIKYDKFMAFKQAAMQLPGVKVVDRSSEAPHAMSFIVDDDNGSKETQDVQDTAIKWEGQAKGERVRFKVTSVGFDFLELMNLNVTEGRGFSRSFATDSSDAFMINEQAVKEMGITDPIGKWVSAWDKKGHIIGVLKNYNTGSLHERILPLIIDVKEYEYFGVVMVRTEAGKTLEAIDGIQQIYKELNGAYPFTFKFIDEDLNRMYGSEKMMTRLSNGFALLAIMISCLGLLGLVMFSAEQRTREIGIRKALGATVASIVTMLSKDFLKIVAISFLIAVPVSAYLMHQWLDGFAYKIDLSWWIFAGAGSLALLIALLTISFQAVKSARANPVESLRSE